MNLQRWILEAKRRNPGDEAFQRGIAVLEQLLMPSHPTETALLPNYPNPFNPETWIPYQLTEPVDVTVSIYATDGTLVRMLDLGHQPVGLYESRSRAVYWDGRNALGEPVASGVYFYTLTAGEVHRHTEDVDKKIVSNDHRIAGMLMFISFPVIADEWVELGSLASSSRNDAFSDQHV